MSGKRINIRIPIFALVILATLGAARYMLTASQEKSGEDIIATVYDDLSEESKSIGDHEAIWMAFKNNDIKFSPTDKGMIITPLFKNAKGENKMKYADILVPGLKKSYQRKGLSQEEARERLKRNFTEEEVELLMDRMY